MRGVFKVLAVILVTLGASVMFGGAGCAVNDPSGTGGEAAPADEVTQAITSCRLDCPTGDVLTCASSPCSIPDANTLICNGVTSHCPDCMPRGCGPGVCGEVSDGCGGTIDCGTCQSGGGCPLHQVDCCGTGSCVTLATCRRLTQLGICNEL